mmetsp:Transcript_76097/g.178533  ORF Transcript_76097/g.178533 Transcript_76097/m.178533 type:complete len:302 (-) Transcript_76097:185-1090(-)
MSFSALVLLLSASLTAPLSLTICARASLAVRLAEASAATALRRSRWISSLAVASVSTLFDVSATLSSAMAANCPRSSSNASALASLSSWRSLAQRACNASTLLSTMVIWCASLSLLLFATSSASALSSSCISVSRFASLRRPIRRSCACVSRATLRRASAKTSTFLASEDFPFASANACASARAATACHSSVVAAPVLALASHSSLAAATRRAASDAECRASTSCALSLSLRAMVVAQSACCSAIRDVALLIASAALAASSLACSTSMPRRVTVSRRLSASCLASSRSTNNDRDRSIRRTI